MILPPIEFYPLLGQTSWLGLTIHYKIAFALFLLLGLTQTVVAVYSGYLAVVALPASISKGKKRRHHFVFWGSAAILFLATVSIGVLNDRNQYASDRKAGDAEADQSKLVEKLRVASEGIRQTNAGLELLRQTLPHSNDESSSELRSLYKGIDSLQKNLSKMVPSAMVQSEPVRSTVPSPPNTFPTVNTSSVKPNSATVTNAELKQRVEQLNGRLRSAESYYHTMNASLVHGMVLAPRTTNDPMGFGASTPREFLGQFEGLTRNRVDQYLQQYRSDVQEYRKDLLSRLNFSLIEREKDETLFRRLDKDASTPFTIQQFGSEDSVLYALSYYLESLSNRLPMP